MELSNEERLIVFELSGSENAKMAKKRRESKSVILSKIEVRNRHGLYKRHLNKALEIKRLSSFASGASDNNAFLVLESGAIVGVVDVVAAVDDAVAAAIADDVAFEYFATAAGIVVTAVYVDATAYFSDWNLSVSGSDSLTVISNISGISTDVPFFLQDENDVRRRVDENAEGEVAQE